MNKRLKIKQLNPFHGTVLLLSPMKTRNLCFPDLFQRVRKKTSAIKWNKDIFKKYVSRMLIFMLVP